MGSRVNKSDELTRGMEGTVVGPSKEKGMLLVWFGRVEKGVEIGEVYPMSPADLNKLAFIDVSKVYAPMSPDDDLDTAAERHFDLTPPAERRRLTGQSTIDRIVRETRHYQ